MSLSFDNVMIIACVAFIVLFLFETESASNISYEYFNDNKSFRYSKDNYKTLKKKYKILPGCRKLNPKGVANLTMNKHKTKNYLKKMGYPVASGFTLKQGETPSQKELFDIMIKSKVKFPVILKPVTESSGNGMISGITNTRKLSKEIRKRQDYKNGLVIEEQLEGIVYRILYVNKKLVAISSRSVPYVTGNGKDTLRTLMKNYKQKLIKTNSKNFPPPVNNTLIEMQGYELNSIIPNNVKVVINNILNYHGGAITRNYPIEKMHSINRKMFESLFGPKFDSNCLGIDFISPDLSVPYYENSAAILEFNSNPARMLHDVMDPGFKKKYLDTLKSK